MTVYGPRVNVHPDRTGARKTFGPNRLIVLHTSEGAENVNSAEGLGLFMASPGDRTNDDGSRFGASYHYVTDTDRVLPAAPEDIVAYAAAGANSDGIHICFPGKAAQTRAQWLDINSLAMINQCAQVMRDIALWNEIPLERLLDSQIRDGEWGYCDHWAISRVYGRSTHTDLGGSFPWDVLAGLLREAGNVSESFEFFNNPNPGSHFYDSRLPAPGDKLDPGVPRTIPVPGGTGKVGAMITVTATEAEAPGFIAVFPGSNDGSSCLNFAPGRDAANTTAVKLASNGTFQVMSNVATHVIVDIVGIYLP